MIEAIRKIPIEILEGQLNELEDSSEVKEDVYTVVFLDINYGIKEVFSGDYKEICKKYELSESQKKLLIDFWRYIGADKFGKSRYGRKGIGAQFGLYTCSPLHYNLGEGIFKSIVGDNENPRERKKIDATLDSLCDLTRPEISLMDKYGNMRKILIKIVEEFFIDIVYNKQENRFNLELKLGKIVFIPEDETFIENYNKFNEEYINLKTNQKFLFYDTTEKYQDKLKQIYSKFMIGDNLIIQDEECNLLSKETFERLELFEDLVDKKKLFRLPLPNFISNNTNIYENCLIGRGKEGSSILNKLKFIYESNNNKPFNYVLISKTSEGWRFENITNFNYSTERLINSEVFELDFNNYYTKKEILKILFSKKYNKHELFYDISFLFWNIKEGNEDKQESFFNPQIKNNPKLDTIIKLNSESIVSLIFKQDNTFIQYRLKKVITDILCGLFTSKELMKRYKDSFCGVKKLLLIYLKYEPSKNMAKNIKEIELKFDSFREDQELTEIQSDDEGYYYSGIILRHLIRNNKSESSDLEIMTKYLVSVSTSEQLKNRILYLTERYSHNLKVNIKMWNRINEIFLKYRFKDNKVKNNLIPIFIGFYSDKYISKGDEQDGR